MHNATTPISRVPFFLAFQLIEFPDHQVADNHTSTSTKGWRCIYVARSRKHNFELKLIKISLFKPILKINFDENTKLCNQIHIKLCSGFRVILIMIPIYIARSRKHNLVLKLTKISPFKPIFKINFDENCQNTLALLAKG